ncbi:Sister chromatid cohesion 1 protein 1 [Rhynchospora pubera]|uniref:Sister chromatid cohesion 1 protein 1 n=1 Tax=Rhynchospora pubera TaxID=906938 RepID=A0AAV8FIR8_9POAL|nr:Sister chromatid cohesion 1 protein 1 [Rhynchospora pubera]
MFYSPKMLGKKGPMGTVWMAAHLERKIKKNQIEKINITVCADRLMFPEAPIALRMSAHLLLGLVRIYAWKVNHTYDDCSRLLTNVRTAYVTLKVIDLPADAHRAPPQSITLPNNFQLDDIDLDDLADDAGGLDAHQKTFDQITITSGEENYVRFLIDENDSSSTSNHSTRSAGPMDDTLPPCSDHMQELITNAKSTEGASALNHVDEAESQFNDAYMDNNQFERAPNEHQDIPNENQSDEFHDILRGSQFDIPNENQHRDIPNDNTSDAIPNENQFHNNTYENLNQDSPIEQLRSLHPTSPIVGNSSIGATCQFSASPNENSNAVRGSFSPVELQIDGFPEEIILVNQNVPRQSPQNNDIPSPRSANAEQDKVELAVAPSPPRVREKRKRKKQQFYFDRQIVLSNKKMKEQLKDSATALLVRKRRRLPSSPLDLWMYQRAHLKDQIFYRPLINWKFASLEEKKTYPPIFNEQPDMDPPLSPPHQFPDNEVIIEELADNEVIIEEPADPPVGLQQSPHHDMGTVGGPPVNSPVVPSHLSPNHSISTEDPSRNPPPGDQYPSPNNDMYPPRSPTQLMPVDANEQPDRLRCQQVDETMQGQSPLVDGSWNTPNSNNNIFNSPSNALPIFEPEVVNSTHSSPAKHTWPVSQSPSTPSHEKRDTFRTPPLKRSAEREDLNFLETPPSIKAKRARVEDGNLSPTVLLENDSARRERNSWSARSMGMAKYLREHLALDPNAGDQNGNISLNQILEGKTRKHCARMFFETLVLTTSNYVQVKQEEAYADVLITPRARLTGMKDRDIPA